MKHDELIGKLRGCEGYRCEDCELRREEFCNLVRMEKAADVIEELQNKLNLWRQDKIRRWIPVSDRLPDRPGSFLCTVYGDSIGENYVTICDYSCRPWHAVTGWFCHAGQRYLEDVTNDVIAWMPLPKPLEEETDG